MVKKGDREWPCPAMPGIEQRYDLPAGGTFGALKGGFDIEAPVEKILEATEAICRHRPGFVSPAEWRKIQVDRLAVAN